MITISKPRVAAGQFEPAVIQAFGIDALKEAQGGGG